MRGKQQKSRERLRNKSGAHPADAFFQLLTVAAVEYFGKIIAVLEAVDVVFTVFTQDFVVDQIKNDITEIFCTRDAPVVEDQKRQGAESLDQKVFNALQKLLPGDMLGTFELLLCKGQGLHKKFIGIRLVAGVGFTDLINDCIKLLIDHVFILYQYCLKNQNKISKFLETN